MDDLLTIPGIGKSIKSDLISLGINKVSDLKGKDPEKLYIKLCKLQHIKLDRCLLYVFRCAVYFAETENPDNHRLLWWNWKDA